MALLGSVAEAGSGRGSDSSVPWWYPSRDWGLPSDAAARSGGGGEVGGGGGWTGLGVPRRRFRYVATRAAAVWGWVMLRREDITVVMGTRKNLTVTCASVVDVFSTRYKRKSCSGLLSLETLRSLSRTEPRRFGPISLWVTGSCTRVSYRAALTQRQERAVNAWGYVVANPPLKRFRYSS